MSHTYLSLLVHCVFSTKERRILVPAELKTSLWPYMAGIARTNKFKAVAVGGMQDHAHVLLSLPTNHHGRQGRAVDQRRFLQMDQ